MRLGIRADNGDANELAAFTAQLRSFACTATPPGALTTATLSVLTASSSFRGKRRGPLTTPPRIRSRH